MLGGVAFVDLEDSPLLAFLHDTSPPNPVGPELTPDRSVRPVQCRSAPSLTLLGNGGANFVAGYGYGEDFKENQRQASPRREPEGGLGSLRHSSGADREVEEGSRPHRRGNRQDDGDFSALLYPA